MALRLKNGKVRLRIELGELNKKERSRVSLGGYESKTLHDSLNLTKRNLKFIVGTLTGHCRLHYHPRELGIPADTVSKF